MNTNTTNRVKSSLSSFILSPFIIPLMLFIFISPAIGSTIFYDDFERTSLGSNWNIISSGGSSGTTTHTSYSGIRSLYTSGKVSTESKSFDTSSLSHVSISAWIRKGADSFSENPDGGENLQIQYLNSSSSWITIHEFLGGGTQGEMYLLTENLNNALHNNFKIRVRQINGTNNYDYWYVDNLLVSTDTVTDSVDTFNFDTINTRTFTKVLVNGKTATNIRGELKDDR